MFEPVTEVAIATNTLYPDFTPEVQVFAQVDYGIDVGREVDNAIAHGDRPSVALGPDGLNDLYCVPMPSHRNWDDETIWRWIFVRLPCLHIDRRLFKYSHHPSSLCLGHVCGENVGIFKCFANKKKAGGKKRIALVGAVPPVGEAPHEFSGGLYEVFHRLQELLRGVAAVAALQIC